MSWRTFLLMGLVSGVFSLAVPHLFSFRLELSGLVKATPGGWTVALAVPPHETSRLQRICDAEGGELGVELLFVSRPTKTYYATLTQDDITSGGHGRSGAAKVRITFPDDLRLVDGLEVHARIRSVSHK